MSVDVVASWPHYAVHLAPVYDALPRDVRGVRWDKRADPRGHAALVSSHRDLQIAKRRKYPRIIYLEHGIGQAYGNGTVGYPGGRGRDAIGLFLSPNGTAGVMDQKAYPAARVEVVGDPRLDTLPEREEDGRTTVAVSFHWDAHRVQEHEGRPALEHYRDALGELAKKVNLIGHAHPKAAMAMATIYRRAGIEFVPTFDEVCQRADLYVCDNSSTIYEFASTGRPVVVLDAPWYRRDVELGLRFWAAADVGLRIGEPGELADVVDAALDDEHEDQREAALDIAYGYRTGAAKRAAAVIVNWLAEQAEAVA